MCDDMDCSLLGRVPLDPELLMKVEQGKPFVTEKPESSTSTALLSIVDKIHEQVNSSNVDVPMTE